MQDDELRVIHSDPEILEHELKGHEVSTVAERGWAGVKNGALLELAADL